MPPEPVAGTGRPSAEVTRGTARRGSLATLAGALLVASGAALLGLLAVQNEQPRTDELPYRYRTTATAPSEAVATLGRLAATHASVETVELVATETDRVVAELAVLRRDDGAPLIAEWRSTLALPVLRDDIDGAEELALVEALRRHLPAGAVVLAMPSRSLRLAALADIVAPLAAADDTAGLHVPEPWGGATEAIHRFEAERHGSRPDDAADAALAQLLEALLAEERQGVAHLQVLAGGGEAYLVLHAQDIFTIGAMRPEAIAVGLVDFPAGGQVHDSARLVRGWVQDNGHAAYAVLPRDRMVIRAFYLSDAAATRSLAAQLLPFNTARLGGVPELTLVFQHGGYWVYRLAAVTPLRDS